MPPAIELIAVRKDYHGVRPLRIRNLVVSEGDIVVLSGVDAAAAEVLSSLVIGATLPDEGVVRVFGDDTAAIRDADAWLARLDRLGIVSDRIGLLDSFTVRQNIAIPMTLDLDPLADEIAARVHSLAAEAGLDAEVLDVAAGLAPATARLRARVARALALGPRVLLVEHPAASISREDVPAVAADFFRLARARGLAALVTSADRDFAVAADRDLVLDSDTGALRRRGLRAWFS